ncbi:MAG: MFS transporter [Anaerolineae bacterium]
MLRARPGYRNLWLAYAVSLFGDWFNTIAVLTIVKRYTEAEQAVRLHLIARIQPPFVIGPVAGVIADRFDRRLVLFATNVLRAFIVLGILFVNSPERVWLLYVLSIAQFVVSAFFEPAQAAILPDLVEPGEVVPANTLIIATWSAMLALGAAAGGVFAAVFGANTALVIDAVTFGGAALLVILIQRDSRPQPTDVSTQASGWQDFVDGLAYLAARPRIAMIAAVKALSQIGSVDIMVAVYAEQIFRLGDDGALSLGLMLGAVGTGAVLGPLIADALGESTVRKLQIAIAVGFVLLPIGWLGFGLAPNLPLAMVALVLRGAGGSLNWTYSSALLQINVPGRYLGRVFSIDFGIFTLVLSFSTWLTGYILDVSELAPRGLVVLLAVASIPSLLVWLGFLSHQARRPEPAAGDR